SARPRPPVAEPPHGADSSTCQQRFHREPGEVLPPAQLHVPAEYCAVEFPAFLAQSAPQAIEANRAKVACQDAPSLSSALRSSRVPALLLGAELVPGTGNCALEILHFAYRMLPVAERERPGHLRKAAGRPEP